MKKRLTRSKSIFLLTLLCAAAFTCLSIIRPLTSAASATSSINVYGRVFQDYNGNGIYDISGSTSAPAIDAGIAGVTVTAYDPNNLACGTATTSLGTPAVQGTYKLSINGTGPYRIEFTNLPPGYLPSGTGTDSDAIATAGTSPSTAGTTEQFIPDQTIEGINLGLNHPSDYCQNNPLVCVPEHFQTSSNVNGGALETFPYDYSSDMDGNLTGSWISQPSRTTPGPLDPKNIAFVNDVGSLYGVAWNPYANAVYTSAFVKRYVKLGALSGESTGAIYVKNNPAATLPTASLYVDLNALFPGAAGTNPHPASTTNWSLDTATNAAVGKVGLGDLEISQDGSTLYVVNLFDRRLYTIPTSGPLTTGTIQSYPIPTSINLPTASCSTKDVRPFALGRDGGGRIYVGAVCSAESTGNPAFLQAYVWYFNTMSHTFTLVAANTMNYQRTYSSTNTINNHPWSATPASLAPQLMLSDIEFDRGDMVLGFRDKNGDETSSNGGFSIGEILRACKGGALGWTFENNGTCGGVGPTTGLFNNGLGGGEFYHEENGEQKGEGLVGGLLQVPGFNHVMTTSFDAVAYESSGSPAPNYNTNGVHRYNNTTGALNGAYDIYIGGQAGTFAKANGVGDIEALCDLAPIEIGNRVWNDANGNGTQDAGEMGIPGVTVHLFKGNLPVTGASAVTDANGEYYFSSAAGVSTTNRKYSIAISPSTAYEIRLDDPANFAGGGPLNGLSSTTANVGTNDSIDSDASDVNGPLGSPGGTFPVITLTTGGPGANDHTFDVGFSEHKACCGTGENYIKNGNFDDGPKGFDSNFTLADTLTPGDYTVGNSETAIKSCENWDIVGHTNCKEDNNFLIVNGMTNQTTGNALAWGQTVQVPKSDKDETYHFCAWFKDLKACCFNQHPKITLEGSTKGHNASSETEVISAPGDKCGWQLVSTDVIVPAGTTNVDLQILLDQNADGDGNDVAIDDISFAGSDPVPAGATDFNIATQVTSGSTDYGITATPLNPQKPDCKYTWTVFEVDASGNEIMPPPVTRQTWTSTGVSNFPGYLMGGTLAGIFHTSHTYRITYRIDCDCMTAREDSFDIRRNPSVLHGLKKGGKNSPAKSDFTITRVNPK
jgi:hypothetical protein